jgi:hypothetical protein
MQEIARRIRAAGGAMQADVMRGAWVSDMRLEAGHRILSLWGLVRTRPPRTHCALRHSSDPASLTATSEKETRAGLPSAVVG